MEKDREKFMTKAGDVAFELKEMNFDEKDNVMAPATTESTPFFTIFCC